MLSILAGKFGFNKEREEEEDDSAPISEAERILKLQDDLLKTQVRHKQLNPITHPGTLVAIPARARAIGEGE